MWRARQDAVLPELARLEEITKSSQAAALTVSAPAVSANLRSKESPARSSAVAGAAGLLAAIALAFAFDYLDDRLRTQEDVERTLGVPVLGVVRRSGFGLRRGHASPGRNSASDRWLSGLTKAQSKRDQEISDRLLKCMAGDSVLVLAVAGLGKGSNDTALALARASAAVGESTALVTDGGRRSGPATGDSTQAKGLETLLTMEGNPSGCLQATPIPGLSVVPYDLSHSAFKRPHLLPRLKRAFSQLAAMSDLVIVDIPTVTEDPSALLMVGASDAALLMVEAGRTTAGSARGVVDRVAALGGRVLGVVLSSGRGQGRVTLGALPETATHKASGPGQLEEVKG
jgi:Mrp family chromosome partitioning ATPase